LPNEALPETGGSPTAIQNRFIALLKLPFKSSDDYRQIDWARNQRDSKADRVQEA
jgi:hypothetical protein